MQNKNLEFQTSSPECFDENMVLVTRKCTMNGWEPKTVTCKAHKPKFCPNHFQEVVHNKDSLCLELIEKSPFKDIGKYGSNPTRLPWTYLRKRNISKVWLPMKTDSEQIYFFNLNPTMSNISMIDWNILPLNRKFSWSSEEKLFFTLSNFQSLQDEKHCLSIESYQNKPRANFENCGSQLHSAYSYFPEEMVIKSSCPGNSLAFIRTPHKCFGTNLKDGRKVKFLEFYENFQWISQSKSIKNTFRLVIDSPVFNPYEYLYVSLSMYKAFIGTENNASADFLTVLEIPKSKISMKLQRKKIEETEILELRCERCDLLLKGLVSVNRRSNDFGFMCYSRSNTYGSLNQLLNITKARKQPDSKKEILYNILLNKRSFQTVWCQGYSIFDYDLVQSNFIKITTKINNNSELVMVVFNYTLKNANKTAAELITEFETNKLQNVSLIKISSVNKTSITLLYHGEIERYLINNFNRKFNVSIKSAEYCKAERLSDVFPNIYWKPVKIGQGSYLENTSFVYPDGTFPYRKCLGSSEDGSYWEPISKERLDSISLRDDSKKTFIDILEAKNESPKNDMENVKKLMESNIKVDRAEIALISKILSRVNFLFEAGQDDEMSINNLVQVSFF